MKLEESLKLFKDFLSPVQKLDQGNLNEISLETILKNVNTNFQETHSDYLNSLEPERILNEQDELWKFALIALNLIEHLNTAEFEKSPSNCYLSIENERLLNVLFQLIICFGIHYNLENNIGIPIEKLSKYGVNITKKRDLVEPVERNRRLVICLGYLLRLKENKREHIDLIYGKLYRRYMHELLCGLIQVTSSPMNSQKSSCDRFLTWLQIDLFKESDGSVLIGSLLMAQSSVRQAKILWFLQRIGQMLTGCLLRPNSVMNVVRAVLNEVDAVANVSLASDWKKCDVIAKIIAQCPKSIGIEKYIEFLSPQLVDLYFKFDPRYSRHFCRVAGSIYSLFADRWPDLTRKYFTTALLSPLDFGSEEIQLEMSTKEFLVKLEQLNVVYLSSTEPSWKTLDQIPLQLIHLIFQVYSQLIPKINATQTRKKCEDLLKLYLNMMPNQENEISQFLTNLLRCQLIPNSSVCHNCMRSKHVDFTSLNDDIEDDLTYNSCLLKLPLVKSNEAPSLDQVETTSKSIIHLLNSLNDSQTKTQFMLHLFNEIQICLDQNPIKRASNSKNDQTFVELENRMNNLEIEINSKIVYFTQLSCIFESVSPEDMIEKHEKIIEFCRLILEKIIMLTLADTAESESELIHLIFSVVSVFTTGLIELSDHVKRSLGEFLPLLAKFKEVNMSIEMNGMAEVLVENIQKLLDPTDRNNNNDNNKEQKAGMKEAIRSDKNKNRVLIEEIEDEYSSCLKDINDPLVPVRAHGLVTLRKLVEKRDQQAIDDFDKVLDMSMRNLKFEDSYVYLAAINVLIALADYRPQKLMDTLINLFQSNEKRLDLDSRLKIGEVLTKSVRNFNELAPKYGTQLLNAFLHGCRSPEELLRASSLSNLGETCKLLQYSLSQHIAEITSCLASLLETDHAEQVQRSAAMVLKMIVEGLRDKNFIEVLGSSALPLYRLLKKTVGVTKDEVVLLHCQLTLENLGDLLKRSMFPEQNLIKEINI